MKSVRFILLLLGFGMVIPAEAQLRDWLSNPERRLRMDAEVLPVAADLRYFQYSLVDWRLVPTWRLGKRLDLGLAAGKFFWTDWILTRARALPPWGSAWVTILTSMSAVAFGSFASVPTSPTRGPRHLPSVFIPWLTKP